jgi:hypothetical protein
VPSTQAVPNPFQTATAWSVDYALAEVERESTSDWFSEGMVIFQLWDRLLNMALARAKPGNRDDTCLWLSCQLRDNGAPQVGAAAIVTLYQQQVPHGDHLYTLKRAMTTLASAYSRPPRDPWAKPRQRARAQRCLDIHTSSYTHLDIAVRNTWCEFAPGVSSTRELLRLHAEGQAKLAQVEAPPMPNRIGKLPRALYEAILLRLSLRVGAGDDRPLPYAASEAVQDAAAAGIKTDKANASAALRSLERRGLIRYMGSLEPRGRPDGTKTYLPGLTHPNP